VSTPLLLYGVTGYTGRLILEEALAAGLRPVLSGRNADEVRTLAAAHGLEARPASLDDAAALDHALREMTAVLHCAGPFSRLGPPMIAACLRTGVHYLDITGEIAVFEQVAAAHEKARSCGVTLLPGVGFDVVPSDCLALHLKQRLPSATELTLAFIGGTGVSRGTATTMIENIGAGGAIRRGGKLQSVPAGWRTREVDFGDKVRHCMTIPWGDISTAWRSTNIPDITVYTAVPRSTVRTMRLTRPLLPLLGLAPFQRFLKSRINARAPGPSAERRAGAVSRLWGEVRDASGNVASARLVAPDGYSLTAMTAVGAAKKVLAGGVPTGAQTPAMAFGADFILEFPRTSRVDLQ